MTAGARTAPPPVIIPMVQERRDILRLSGVLLGLLAMTGILLALTGTGSGSGSSAPDAATGTMDGILRTVEVDRLVLAPSDGGEDVTFEIRRPDRQALDIFHLETHARNGLPSRVHYVSDGNTRYAVRVDDL